MNAIELSHINKSFGDFAIRDLNLAVPSGTICGLVGENGAGKSTTIRLLMGALRPDSGTASVLGTDVSSPEFREVKEDVGVVLDEAYFPESLNAVQVGKIMAATYRRWDQKLYDSYLKRFDLPEKKQFKDFSRGMRMKLAIAVALSHQPKLLVLDEAYFPESLNAVQVGKIMAATYRRWDQGLYDGYLKRFDLPQNKQFKDYSRGMRMKLAIAVALSHQPKLLVLDEATAGLDPIVRDEVLDIFNEFTREEDHSILISSHILSDLEKLCDYIAFIHQGNLLFCEEKDRLLEEYGIFTDSAEQLECLLPEAIVAREPNGYGGVRALIRRDLAPAGFQLEKPSVEDIVLFLVKGAKTR